MSRPARNVPKKVFSYVYPYVAPVNLTAADYTSQDGDGKDENGWRIIANQDFMGCVISILEGDIVYAQGGAMVTTAATSFKYDGPGLDPHPNLRDALVKRWPKGGEVTKCYVTKPFELEYCNNVFHVVAPDYRPVLADDADEQLAAQAELDLKRTYQNAMRAAMREGWQSMVFPLISVGNYQFPPKKAAEIALKTIRDVLAAEGFRQFFRITIMLPERDESGSEETYEDLFPNYFPEPPPAPPPTSPPQPDSITSVCGGNTKANTPCKHLVIRVDGQPPFCPQHMPRAAVEAAPAVVFDENDLCGQPTKAEGTCTRFVRRVDGIPAGCWQHGN